MENPKLRLLVVDDEESWRITLRDLFRNNPDIVVEEAASGDEAVERIKAEEFDLVLLDIRMPSGTEGLDALSKIKEIKPQTGVIVISGYGDIPKTVDAMNRGAIDFLEKGREDFYPVVKHKVTEFQRTAFRVVKLIAYREQLIRENYEKALTSDDSHVKGKALETVLKVILESVDGFSVETNVKTETEEIDLVVTNKSLDPFWHKESTLILAECKNWHSQRVGKNEFINFLRKVENRAGRCKLGFFICTERFAETFRDEQLRASRDGHLVVPIDGDGLRRLVESSDRSKLLQEFVVKATMI